MKKPVKKNNKAVSKKPIKELVELPTIIKIKAKKKKSKKVLRKRRPGKCEHCLMPSEKVKTVLTTDEDFIVLCYHCLSYLKEAGLMKNNHIITTKNYIVDKLARMRKEVKDNQTKSIKENKRIHTLVALAKDNKFLIEEVKIGVYVEVVKQTGQFVKMRIYGGAGSNSNKKLDVACAYMLKYKSRLADSIMIACNYRYQFLGFLDVINYNKLLKMPHSKCLMLPTPENLPEELIGSKTIEARKTF